MGRSYTKVILVALPAPGGGGEYRFQGRADWELWTYPSGTVVLNEDGSIGLRRYRKNINAAANASEFERASKDAKGMVPGGIRYAPSNPGTGSIGGMAATWRMKSCRRVFISAGFGSPPLRATRPRTALST